MENKSKKKITVEAGSGEEGGEAGARWGVWGFFVGPGRVGG